MNILSPSVCYSSLLFFFLLTACGPLQETVNSYNENLKCRARDDAGECIDIPTAYKKARYPVPAPREEAEPATGIIQEIQDNRYRFVTGLLEEEESWCTILSVNLIKAWQTQATAYPFGTKYSHQPKGDRNDLRCKEYPI